MTAVSIIGAGRLGASLGYALLKKGFEVMVLCSGGLAALLRAEASLIEKAAPGKKKTPDILRPLAQRTLRNVKEVGFAGALSGPIVRDDAGTILAHLKTIPEKGGSRRLNKTIGLINLETISDTGGFSSLKIKALKTLLEGW